MDDRQWANLQTYNAHKDLVESLFELRVLDPAMGSGHFLVETVDFVTDQMLKFLNQFPINPVNFALNRTRESIKQSLSEQGVFVDDKKLTDINLLKRHVLKRCIYGVDLNPMAVELAKVSLWLDVFTLGAPLNFLDHHLRCGNSLIGATFKDLEEATKNELFKLDYSPLLRAINHVLFVSRMADATAAEVHRSSDEYGHARQELAGYARPAGSAGCEAS
jgi:type II restriction/modification system DNA methylase subunit YeeA